MSDHEIKLSIITLVVSSIINIISIGVNCFLAYRQSKENKKIKEFDTKREVITRYYLPIKYLLNKLDATYLQIKSENNDFSMFNLYINDVAMRKKRADVLQIYKEYILLHERLNIQYADASIDYRLGKLYSHMQIILIFDNDAQISKYSKKYELPNVSDLINDIERYAEKFKLYV